VPLPIEPKPIITIGPVMRPCRGQWVMALYLLQGRASSKGGLKPRPFRRVNSAAKRVSVAKLSHERASLTPVIIRRRLILL
jgi:hypothetical protein